MTREQIFRSTFANAFAAYTEWVEVLEAPVKKLPISSFTSFSLELGKTRFENHDSTGRALSGEQDFTITIYFSKPQNDTAGIHNDHSDDLQLAQQFINDHIYPIPLVLPGDTFRIDDVEIVSVEPMRILAGQSRYTVVVNARYWFSCL
ncbi:MAG TPA: hypothetical protein VFO76_04590 [Candidatus Kapabacteria bacterium]|nr:hypothetical protein [Candidatus Kapabacteria bacterium]